MTLFYRILISIIAIAMPLFFVNCQTTSETVASTETAPKTEMATPSKLIENNN